MFTDECKFFEQACFLEKVLFVKVRVMVRAAISSRNFAELMVIVKVFCVASHRYVAIVYEREVLFK